MKLVSDKVFETKLKILDQPEVEKEVKVSLILEMIYHGDISLAKAKELCTDHGIFSDHWIKVDDKTTDVFSNMFDGNILENSSQEVPKKEAEDQSYNKKEIRFLKWFFVIIVGLSFLFGSIGGLINQYPNSLTKIGHFFSNIGSQTKELYLAMPPFIQGFLGIGLFSFCILVGIGVYIGLAIEKAKENK